MRHGVAGSDRIRTEDDVCLKQIAGTALYPLAAEIHHSGNRDEFMFKTMASLVFPVALLAGGCIDEAPVDQSNAHTGESVQAFSSNWSYSWGDTKFSKADIGTAVGRGCFLSGIAGYLTTNKFPEGNSQAGAGVQLNAVTNHYEIYVAPAFTATLQAWVRCVNSTTLTPEMTWRTGDAKKFLALATPNRQCFLTSLTTGREADDGIAHGGFASTLDQVWISNDSGSFYLQGSQSGLVWAKARCTDFTQDFGASYGFANTGSSGVTPLEPATNGTNCFLQQVQGQLTAANDWVNGPYISYNAGYNYFDFNYKNGTGGRARCMR
jgi:hypothetical protein